MGRIQADISSREKWQLMRKAERREKLKARRAKERQEEQTQIETVQFLEPARVKLEGEERAVAVVAGRLGLMGESFEAMAQTWLRPIVDEGLGATDRGLDRARVAIKLLGLMLSGVRVDKARERVGLTKAEEVAFRFACPEFDKLYKTALAAMKESMGEKVLGTAYDLATDGTEVYDKEGNVVGRRKSEKMLDRLLVMSGEEFRKEKVPGGGGGGGTDRANVTVELHFDRKGMPSSATVEAVDV